jgi:hypothetical protein
MRISKKRRKIDRRHIQRRQLVGALARRGLLEDQRLILRLVGADFAKCLGTGGFIRLRHNSLSFETDTLGDSDAQSDWLCNRARL